MAFTPDGMFYVSGEELTSMVSPGIKAIGGMMGFKTKEEEINDILRNADYSTSAGRNEAIQKIMQIDPATGRKFMQQNADYEYKMSATKANEARAEAESFKSKNPNYKEQLKDRTSLRLNKEWEKAEPDRILNYLENVLNFSKEEIGNAYQHPARAIEFLRGHERYDDKTGHMRDAVTSFKDYLKKEETDFKLENKYAKPETKEKSSESKETIKKEQLWNSDLKD